jgi:ABC-type antimicrobial peptide transport system permease subunit
VLCAIIIFLTLKYEFSFDAHHQNNAEIYRVTNNYYYPTFTMHVGNSPDPMWKALKNDFPAFKNVFPIHTAYNHNITIENQTFESDIIYCPSAFIETFDYYNDPSQWLVGNPNNVLSEVNKTVLTQGLAEKLFGDYDNAIGKIITLSNDIELEVGAIIKNPPNNTNYPFEQLVAYATYERIASESFGGVSSTTTFVQIPSAVNIANLKPTLKQFNKKYMEAVWGEDFVSMDLQALSDIHFDNRFDSNNYTTNSTYLWSLGLIGLFMILIACINFINLTTAKAINRSKEIGVRKILGSSKQNIIAQFMNESFLLALISIGLGFMLAQLLFPYFSELTNLNIGNHFTYTKHLIIFVIGLLFFITLSMGLYPAFVLSRFQPIEAIRSTKYLTPIKNFTIRRGLIAFQLMIAQVLVIGAIVITYQLQYFENKDLGFDDDSILVVNIPEDESYEKKLALKNKMKQFPFVSRSSLASSVPMSGHFSSTGLTSKDSEIKDRFNVQYIFADNDYADAMNFELLAGKTALNEIAQDTIRSFVVNETLIQRLAFDTPESAIGKRINIHGVEAQIMGVVKNFHTLSLHENIRPVALVYGARNYSNLAIKYQTEHMQTAITQLETAWKSVFPNSNFDYYFQNEQLGDMYENETRFSLIIKVFTLISILIASIGLVGLSAFSSSKRFKEIGVRKVLGATVSDILFLMSKEFIGLTIIGFILSIPIAYYFVSIWLEEFAYHIHMEWWMVLIAGISTLLLTLITVGLQSLKAAVINPIQSLRDE